MKKILVILALIAFMSCDGTGINDKCWLCTYQSRTTDYVWNDWYQRWDTEYTYSFDKQKKICGDSKPYSTGQYPTTKITCVEL